jgi:hypothetical protein
VNVNILGDWRLLLQEYERLVTTDHGFIQVVNLKSIVPMVDIPGLDFLKAINKIYNLHMFDPSVLHTKNVCTFLSNCWVG